jgi:lipoprotein-releasing system permease protein
MILIVIVAAANVFSSIVMIVMDRTQEIAILKSMGARPSTISLSFLFTGFYTGAVGAFIGIVIGLLVAVNINEVFKIVDLLINGTIWIFDKVIAPFYTIEKKADFVILNPQFYLEKIPIKISITELLFVAVITISLSVLSAVIPARNAGNIRPIEIIRKY